MTTIHDFSPPSKGDSEWSFGISNAAIASGLRKLADDFDAGRWNASGAIVLTYIANIDDFTHVRIEINAVEKRPVETV